jgi:serine protease Do
VSVRDAEPSQADRRDAQGGVVVDDVRPDSPAQKAGLKRSDVIVEFDGERVRSARQFARLVSETPPGRTVTATIVREGRRQSVQVTPSAGQRFDVFVDGPRLRAQLDDQVSRGLRRFNFENFDFDFDGWGGSSRRLGVAVTELSPQLAGYFGVKDGVLVASVTEDSPASRAGLKAGDVITSVGGTTVGSTGELVRLLRDAGDAEVTLGIVRDKRELTVKATPESRRPRAPARPV